MAKINFDYDSIQRSVIPAIEGSCEHINQAKNTINNVYIPSDCAYRSYLSGLYDKLSNIQSKLSRAKNWCQSTNSDLEDTLDTLKSDISSIQIAKVTKK